MICHIALRLISLSKLNQYWSVPKYFIAAVDNFSRYIVIENLFNIFVTNIIFILTRIIIKQDNFDFSEHSFDKIFGRPAKCHEAPMEGRPNGEGATLCFFAAASFLFFC